MSNIEPASVSAQEASTSEIPSRNHVEQLAEAFGSGLSLSSDTTTPLPQTPTNSQTRTIASSQSSPFSFGQTTTVFEGFKSGPEPPRTPNSTRPSIPSFSFAQSDSQTQTSTGRDVPSSSFSFEQQPLISLDANDNSSAGFSFRYLHNASPSPAPSPQSSPFHQQCHIAPPRKSRRSASTSRISQPNAGSDNAGSSNTPLLFGSQQIQNAFTFNDTSNLRLREPERLSALANGLGSHLRARSTSDAGPLGERQADVRPYDIRDEQAPKSRFFTSEFQGALRKGLDIAKQAAKAIEKLSGLTEENDAALASLLADAKRLSTFQGTDTRTVAVLGDSGDGKSSLINSLLHFKDLAHTSDSGLACTSVVTEYRQKSPDQQAPITIKVEYLTPSEIEESLAELLWSYRKPFLPIAETQPLSTQEEIRLTEESDRALFALEAAFGHCPEFSESFLQDSSEGALERINQQLVIWSKDLKWPEGGVDGFWLSTAATADECRDKTEVFMTDKYWPFTKIIRIYLNAQVLKTGIILADLPGLRDTNLARVRATQDYLMHCNNIFIVAKISRAITDSSIRSSLFSAIAQHVPMEWAESGASSLNIAVICTNSESIDIDTARRDFCGAGKPIPAAEMDALDKKIKTAKASGNWPLKTEAKFRQKMLLMQARNNHVKEGLQRAYAAKAPGGRLDVFCVSNKLYKKHSSEGSMEHVRVSGVPDIRRFCYTITADAQLREAQHFLQSSLFNLVNSVDICANRLSRSDQEEANREGEVSIEAATDKLQEMRGAGQEEMLRLGQGINTDLQEQILEHIDSMHPRWTDEATRREQEWDSWHWSKKHQKCKDNDNMDGDADSVTVQYNSWCMNNGNHETAKRPREDWNAKIIWKMRTDLGTQWEIIEESIPTAFKDALESIQQLFADLKKTLQESLSTATYTSLEAAMNSRMETVKYKMGLSEQHCISKMLHCRRLATETNSASDVLYDMVPIYRRACLRPDYGGKSAYQKSVVRGHIQSGQIFPNITDRVSTRVDNLVQEIENELLGLWENTITRMQRDIDLALAASANSAPSSERVGNSDIFEQLLANIAEWKASTEELKNVSLQGPGEIFLQ